VERRGEYLLIQMPGVALRQEGLYRFELACGAGEPAVCEVYVLVNACHPARILVTLRDLPVREEGTHRFAVYLDQDHPVAVEVPVYIMPTERRAQVH
jgi:hypothetical protein